ncbi:hypothetical protein [Hymenobacter metallilatus]|uniref:Uncharacterized protein n=1 Tax=Hymenobacter metallilatus TaxID=2493666 RepID=A0A3R9NKQ4_9BACT|nr:hypothetical protein [Hymenobacter metallilatus]RSK35489.1 hypothetical protein EI290_07270 [Hymenobacter metallilatus]
MTERVITLCYRKIIDAAATRPWDKLVLEDTYNELRIQAQLYNPERRFRTYAELVHHVPGASQLSFLVSGVARGYLPQLGGLVPDVVDNLGRRFLRFSRFQFEIINSDLLDKSRHQVTINFFSDPLTWHATIENLLLVSAAAADPENREILTHLVPLQPFLGIYSIQTPAAV